MLKNGIRELAFSRKENKIYIIQRQSQFVKIFNPCLIFYVLKLSNIGQAIIGSQLRLDDGMIHH